MKLEASDELQSNSEDVMIKVRLFGFVLKIVKDTFKRLNC